LEVKAAVIENVVASQLKVAGNNVNLTICEGAVFKFVSIQLYGGIQKAASDCFHHNYGLQKGEYCAT
jgi:hypothetical protein